MDQCIPVMLEKLICCRLARLLRRKCHLEKTTVDQGKVDVNKAFRGMTFLRYPR